MYYYYYYNDVKVAAPEMGHGPVDFFGFVLSLSVVLVLALPAGVMNTPMYDVIHIYDTCDVF